MSAIVSDSQPESKDQDQQALLSTPALEETPDAKVNDIVESTRENDLLENIFGDFDSRHKEELRTKEAALRLRSADFAEKAKAISQMQSRLKNEINYDAQKAFDLIGELATFIEQICLVTDQKLPADLRKRLEATTKVHEGIEDRVKAIATSDEHAEDIRKEILGREATQNLLVLTFESLKKFGLETSGSAIKEAEKQSEAAFKESEEYARLIKKFPTLSVRYETAENDLETAKRAFMQRLRNVLETSIIKQAGYSENTDNSAEYENTIDDLVRCEKDFSGLKELIEDTPNLMANVIAREKKIKYLEKVMAHAQQLHPQMQFILRRSSEALEEVLKDKPIEEAIKMLETHMSVKYNEQLGRINLYASLLLERLVSFPTHLDKKHAIYNVFQSPLMAQNLVADLQYVKAKGEKSIKTHQIRQNLDDELARKLGLKQDLTTTPEGLRYRPDHRDHDLQRIKENRRLLQQFAEDTATPLEPGMTESTPEKKVFYSTEAAVRELEKLRMETLRLLQEHTPDKVKLAKIQEVIEQSLARLSESPEEVRNTPAMRQLENVFKDLKSLL